MYRHLLRMMILCVLLCSACSDLMYNHPLVVAERMQKASYENLKALSEHRKEISELQLEALKLKLKAEKEKLEAQRRKNAAKERAAARRSKEQDGGH